MNLSRKEFCVYLVPMNAPEQMKHFLRIESRDRTKISGMAEVGLIT